jgi:hypothetical protein
MQLLIKGSPKHLYYLNDYPTLNPSLRIERSEGGERCLWKERTSLKKMEETKKYLASCWHRTI